MADFDILDTLSGQPTGDKVSVSEEFLASKPKTVPAFLHEVVTAYRANRHRGTHSTLTRGEVSGGGRKPWKQKHTGRARAGSTRSPLWRKGGVIFGPKPRSYFIDVGKNKRKQALTVALVDHFPDRVRFVKEEIFANVGRTRDLNKILKIINVDTDPLLVLVAASGLGVYRAGRNLPNCEIRAIDHCHAYEVLKAKWLVFTDKAWVKYQERWRHGA